MSDPNAVEEILQLQGIPWLLRKAILIATVKLAIKHGLNEEGVEKTEVASTLTGGISTSVEINMLDWTLRPFDGSVFGKGIGKAKRVDSPGTIEDSYLKEGWYVPQGGSEEGVLLFCDESVGDNKRWTIDQVHSMFII